MLGYLAKVNGLVPVLLFTLYSVFNSLVANYVLGNLMSHKIMGTYPELVRLFLGDSMGRATLLVVTTHIYSTTVTTFIYSQMFFASFFEYVMGEVGGPVLLRFKVISAVGSYLVLAVVLFLKNLQDLKLVNLAGVCTLVAICTVLVADTPSYFAYYEKYMIVDLFRVDRQNIWEMFGVVYYFMVNQFQFVSFASALRPYSQKRIGKVIFRSYCFLTTFLVIILGTGYLSQPNFYPGMPFLLPLRNGIPQIPDRMMKTVALAYGIVMLISTSIKNFLLRDYLFIYFSGRRPSLLLRNSATIAVVALSVHLLQRFVIFYLSEVGILMAFFQMQLVPLLVLQKYRSGGARLRHLWLRAFFSLAMATSAVVLVAKILRLIK